MTKGRKEARLYEGGELLRGGTSVCACERLSDETAYALLKIAIILTERPRLFATMPWQEIGEGLPGLSIVTETFIEPGILPFRDVHRFVPKTVRNRRELR